MTAFAGMKLYNKSKKLYNRFFEYAGYLVLLLNYGITINPATATIYRR